MGWGWDGDDDGDGDGDGGWRDNRDDGRESDCGLSVSICNFCRVFAFTVVCLGGFEVEAANAEAFCKARMAKLTNSSNVTIALTGFPAKPNTNTFSTVAKVVGLPVGLGQGK